MPFLFVLLCIEVVLFATNYTPGTWLLGWDNIAPELDFKTNLMRSVFGVWQEYRGLGLYDGMSHIANLPHTLFLWLVSLVIPTHLLRYFFIFGMHLAGGIGMYILLSHILDKTPLKRDFVKTSWAAFCGSLFYLFNLTTIQIFHTPLEAFAVHFAALPWLTWSLISYLQTPSRKNYLMFLFISLITTPQFFVPTIMIPIAILLATISLVHTSWKHVWTAAIGFVLVNVFWLLPYLYGLPRTAPVIAEAKINQMSSSEAFLRNQSFGNLSDVLLLRGFPLDFEDYTTDGMQIYLMSAWRTLALSPQYFFIGGILLGLLGILTVIKRRKLHVVIFVIPLLASVLILASNTPGIRDIMAHLRDNLPFLGEALRFPFTKFGLLFIFCLTIFISQGLTYILHRYKFIVVAFLFMLIVISYPVIQGQFIHPNMRVHMPQEYTDLYAFFNTKNTSNRIALLPQPAYWSWKLYRFGYRGSGFSWFGIPQPVLDRAFDPWSGANENYYWELSNALYAKDANRLKSVFAKYGVKYILMDENVVSAGNNRALFISETKELLAGIPDIKQMHAFGKLTLYERTDTSLKNFVDIQTDLPSVNPYSWTDNDVAYRELGDYIEGNEINYPHRSLFTKRSVSERDFDAASLRSDEAIVYDSTTSADLNASAVKACGLLKTGHATAKIMDDGIRFESINQRGCLSFGIPGLSHKEGYLVAVESRHISGRPLQLSIINQTAQHVELETFLSYDTNWNNAFFILPPLAPDGLGYNPYISNDSIGNQQTINDLKSIRFYKLPYDELVGLKSGEIASSSSAPRNDIQVSHPNPALYKVIIHGSRVEPGMTSTIILSQSFDTGWLAVTPSKTFPFLAPVGRHVLVNNWANGWNLTVSPSQGLTVYIFFWPQLLEFLGFALLPLPFLWILLKRNR